MLSFEETRILKLIEELGNSSLNLTEQFKPVEEITDLIQEMEDGVEEQELLGKPASRTFIVLSRRRLVEAQKLAVLNFDLLRQQKVNQIHTKPQDLSDEQRLFGDRTRADLQQSIYESKTETMTQILNRMHGMAQEEVIKGKLNIDELDMSSKTLTELQDKYSAVDMLLNGSKRLVKLLEEADQWDRRCMLASLGFLAFAFTYVVYRRILHGPLKLVFWVVLKFLGVSRAVTNAVSPKKVLETVGPLEKVLNTPYLQSTETFNAIETALDTVASSVIPVEAPSSHFETLDETVAETVTEMLAETVSEALETNMETMETNMETLQTLQTELHDEL